MASISAVLLEMMDTPRPSSIDLRISSKSLKVAAMSNEDLSKPSFKAASSKDFLVADPVSLQMNGYLTASLNVMLFFIQYDLGARRTTMSVNIL